MTPLTAVQLPWAILIGCSLIDVSGANTIPPRSYSSERLAGAYSFHQGPAMIKRVVLSAVMFLVPAMASATTITIDNFESGNLNAWNPIGFGQIVVDPLNSSNHALNFTALGDGGNIWTASTYAATGNDWWFSFDYLGLPAAGNPLGTGGFVGWDDDTFYAGNERWLAGTPGGGADQLLIDDGAWHHQVIHLTRSGTPNLWPTAVYLKMEDWVHSDGIAGNAYLDNIAITDVPPDGPAVPEPASLVLLASGLLLIARRLR